MTYKNVSTTYTSRFCFLTSSQGRAPSQVLVGALNTDLGCYTCFRNKLFEETHFIGRRLSARPLLCSLPPTRATLVEINLHVLGRAAGRHNIELPIAVQVRNR